MANEQDNVAGLVAGILIAGETQRQAEQANRSAEQAKSERDAAERRAQKERSRADALVRKSHEDHESALDNLRTLRRNFIWLLGLPLEEIANRSGGLNPAFRKNYEELMLLLGERIVSQKAFKELSIRLGSKLGLSLEEVLVMAQDCKEDVISNRNLVEHNSNASDSMYTRGKEDALRTKITAGYQSNVDWYKRRVANGEIYDLLDTPPIHLAAMIQAWKRLAAQGSREAQLNLGLAYLNKWQVQLDFERAEDLLHEALKQQEPKACYELYRYYLKQDNPRRDSDKSKHYLKLAAANNDQRAVAAAEAVKQEEIRQEVLRTEEALQRPWLEEELGLLEQLSVIREDEFPQELFDKIQGRGYEWEPNLKLLHTLTLTPIISKSTNEGTWLRPNRTAWISIEGRFKEGDLSGKTVYVWSEFYNRFENAFCRADKPGTINLGKYPLGTVIEKLTLEHSVGIEYGRSRMTIKLTFVPRHPFVVAS